jgi:hypothetical protein
MPIGIFSGKDFYIFSDKKAKLRTLAPERRAVWEKMAELSQALQPLLLEFDPRLRGRLSQHWISARKPEGVRGIWLAFSEATPYYQGCQYNVGIYSDGIYVGLVVPWQATHDRQRIAEFIIHRPGRFLSLARRLRGSNAFVEYGDRWNFISEFDQIDLEKYQHEMRHAEWFTIAEWFRPRGKRPNGRRLLSFILKTFRSLQPLYAIAAGLDPKFEGRTAKVRLLSMKDIAAKEAWSMRVVKKFERKHGRVPADVSLDATGYDLVSRDRQGAERFIEVKSRVGGYPLELTEGEYKKAKQLRKEYYVYVVSGDTCSPQLSLINDPLRSCEIVPVETISWRIENWQKVTNLIKP